jgi:hypothetical protein
MPSAKVDPSLVEVVPFTAVADDGFPFRGRDRASERSTLALVSLRIALEAWFSTYRALGPKIHMFDSDYKLDQGTYDFNHGSAYFEAYSETIVHLQHFAELVCKDFLRFEHPLLATVAGRDAVLLHKLLKGDAIAEEEMATQRSLEFSDALYSLVDLLKAKRLNRKDIDFVLSHAKTLELLNTLRNRTWHRGTWTLRYPTLDLLVGRHVLPFVLAVTSLPEYASLQRVWTPKPLDAPIDLFAEITRTFAAPKHWSLHKVAYLKELGRAAYANPLENSSWHKHDDERARRRATALVQEDYSVETCPACGVNSLSLLYDTDVDEASGAARTYVFRVECECCTFRVGHELTNASIVGLSLPDYWREL